MTHEQAIELIVYIVAFLYGTIIGSFTNVLIYRLPKKENFTTERSHCMTCGEKIKWYDLIPLFSYLLLRGKCRHCGTHISAQYPIVEGLNGIAYVFIFLVNGINAESIIYCLTTSILITISIIDWRTYEIPFGLNIAIFVLGIVRVILDYENWLNYVVGFLVVSGFMLICLYIGRALKGIDAFGGGDIKLMAAAGVMIGWKSIILAFILGCILGAVIHSIRMKISDAEHVLAFGPYLCVGLFISMLFGEQIMNWYIGMF